MYYDINIAPTIGRIGPSPFRLKKLIILKGNGFETYI